MFPTFISILGVLVDWLRTDPVDPQTHPVFLFKIYNLGGRFQALHTFVPYSEQLLTSWISTSRYPVPVNGNRKVCTCAVLGSRRGATDGWYRRVLVAAGADCSTVERLPAQQ